MLRRTRLASVLVLAAVPACVTSPESHTSLDPNARTIEFTGVANYQPGLKVQIQGKTGPGGFTGLATTSVDRQGRWSVSIPVPLKYFGKGTCGQATFRAVAKPGHEILKAIDHTCVDHLPPNPSKAQIQACAVEEIVVDRGSASYTGDLDLNGAAEAAAYQCLTSLDGDLTIHGGRAQVTPGTYQPGLSFALPKLASISGNLTIDGDRAEQVSLPSLTQVGGSVSLSKPHFATLIPPATPADDPVFAFPVTDIGLPLLATVGSDIELNIERENTPGSSGAFIYDFGLDAVTNLGGSVHVINDVFPATLRGLNSLTTIHGDAIVDWGVSDLFTTPLLSSVTHVEGNFELIGPPNSRGLMAALATVDGNVSLHASSASGYMRLDHQCLSGLAHVGGDLLMHRTDTEGDCDNLLPSLTQLDGALQMTDSRGGIRLGATGASHLALGSVHISDSLVSYVPLNADAVVAPAGAIEVTSSDGLCPCTVDAFVAQQQASGWVGTATNTANGAGVTCSSCPDAFCP